MVCILSTIAGLIIWPGSAYLMLAFMGWLGHNQRMKIYNYIHRFNDYADELIPIIKFRNVKPLHKNIKNLLINILKFLFRLMIVLVLAGIFFVILYFTYTGLDKCYSFF